MDEIEKAIAMIKEGINELEKAYKGSELTTEKMKDIEKFRDYLLMHGKKGIGNFQDIGWDYPKTRAVYTQAIDVYPDIKTGMWRKGGNRQSRYYYVEGHEAGSGKEGLEELKEDIGLDRLKDLANGYKTARKKEHYVDFYAEKLKVSPEELKKQIEGILNEKKKVVGAAEA